MAGSAYNVLNHFLQPLYSTLFNQTHGPEFIPEILLAEHHYIPRSHHCSSGVESPHASPESQQVFSPSPPGLPAPRSLLSSGAYAQTAQLRVGSAADVKLWT